MPNKKLFTGKGYYIDKDGYKYIRYNPIEHSPFKSMFTRNYAPEHRIVMAKHLGRPLSSNEHVHHKNKKRASNAISNLWLYDSKDHLQTHIEKGELKLFSKEYQPRWRKKDLKSIVDAVRNEKKAYYMATKRPDIRRKVRVFLEGKGDRFLFQRALTNPKKFRLPGGGIEKGEKPLAAVKRELFEEFDIRPKNVNIKYLGKSDNSHPATQNEYYYYVKNHGLKPGSYRDKDDPNVTNTLIMRKPKGKNFWGPSSNIFNKLEKLSYDPKEIAMGMEVEREHDNITKGNPKLVRKIVNVHMKESPKYYTYLKRMEKKMPKKASRAGWVAGGAGLGASIPLLLHLKRRKGLTKKEKKKDFQKSLGKALLAGGAGVAAGSVANLASKWVPRKNRKDYPASTFQDLFSGFSKDKKPHSTLRRNALIYSSLGSGIASIPGGIEYLKAKNKKDKAKAKKKIMRGSLLGTGLGTSFAVTNQVK